MHNKKFFIFAIEFLSTELFNIKQEISREKEQISSSSHGFSPLRNAFIACKASAGLSFA